MQLITAAFSHGAYQSLPPKVGEFFLNLAHVRNDLRIPLYLIFAGSNGIRNTSDIEYAASSHYYQYALRLAAATMFEAWKLLEEGLGRTDVKAALGGGLAPEADSAFSDLVVYFSNPENHVRRIRNKLAFHFDPIELGKAFGRPKDGTHRMVTGMTVFNQFYLFAEEAAARVMFGVLPTDTHEEAQAKVRAIGDEISKLISDVLTVCDAVLVGIATGEGSGLGMRPTGRCEVSPTKVRELWPALFADEDPEEIRKTVEERMTS